MKNKSPFTIFIAVSVAGLLLMSLYMYVTGQNSTGDIFSPFRGVVGQRTINFSVPLFVAVFLALLFFVPGRIAEKFNSNFLIKFFAWFLLLWLLYGVYRWIEWIVTHKW